MTDADRLARALLGRDVAVAYGVVVGLYLVRHVRLQPLQIPAYLLIVSYDLVEASAPAIAPYHPVGFPIYLYLLAVVAAGASRSVRPAGPGARSWAGVLGGVCLVVGALALGFAALVGGPLVAAHDNPTPLAITGSTALVLFAAGWWLLDRPSIGPPRWRPDR